MKTIKFLSIIMAVAVIFGSCSKGDTGATGPAGANGTNGVANITSNIWTVTNWGWSSPVYYVNLSDNNITATVLNSGLVTTWASVDAGTTWNAIPTTHVGSVENAFWGCEYQVGTLYVTFEWNTQGADGDPNSTYSANVQIKDVVIPPAMLAAHPNINWQDYRQVNAIMATQNMIKK